MFDIGFSELFLVGIVALLVLGPERLPRAARLTGLWVRRARAQWYSVKSELESELADEELKRSLRQTRDELQQAQSQLRQSGDVLHRELDRQRKLIGGSAGAPQTPPRPGPEDPRRDRPGPAEPDPHQPPRRDPDPDEPSRRDPQSPPPVIDPPRRHPVDDPPPQP